MYQKVIGEQAQIRSDLRKNATITVSPPLFVIVQSVKQYTLPDIHTILFVGITFGIQTAAVMVNEDVETYQVCVVLDPNPAGEFVFIYNTCLTFDLLLCIRKLNIHTF